MLEPLEETWRWFGPDDPIRLAEIRQTGARGIVTALHQIPYGEVWTRDDIETRQALIEGDRDLGMRWRVVESLPVHEAIKRGEGDLRPLFENYRTSLRNLASCGVRTVCYNFMPVLDWMRTDLAAPLPGGGRQLRFNAHHHAAFDCFMLGRPGAEAEHDPAVVERARDWYRRATADDRQRLLDTVMAGLPGAFDRYDVPQLREVLALYRDIDADALRANLRRFLEEVVPTAEEVGIRLGIHPDDPPRPLFGLPRIVSTADDLAFIVDAVDSPANGITLCTGSLGARPENDVPAIARRFADRVCFAHLRNVANDPDGSFAEAEHLGGDVDMVAVVATLIEAQARRRAAGDPDWRLPMRPDHGHELLGDVGRPTHPGYPLIGRMRGLAELRGVMTAVAALGGRPAGSA